MAEVDPVHAVFAGQEEGLGQVLGHGDDLAVLLYVLNKVGNVSEEIKEKAKAKLVKWFDEDEMEEISEIKFQDKPKEEE